MATQVWSSVIDWSTDAGMRAAVAELITKLGTLGLVQTADTGQIDTTTAVRGTAGSIAGYFIFKFPDSSLYIKFEISSMAVVTSPGVYITVGTGSNGSGTLTGQLSTRIFSKGTSTGASVVGVITSTVTNYTSYACLTSDNQYFMLVWKAQSTGGSYYPVLALSVSKHVDTTGATAGTGFIVRNGFGINQHTAASLCWTQSVRTAAVAVTYNGSTSFCVVPGDITNSSVGADKQLFLHAFPTPRSVFDKNQATCIIAEVAYLTTLTATLVGSTPLDYISMGVEFGGGNTGSFGAATWGHVCRWEP